MVTGERHCGSPVNVSMVAALPGAHLIPEPGTVCSIVGMQQLKFNVEILATTTTWLKLTMAIEFKTENPSPSDHKT